MNPESIVFTNENCIGCNKCIKVCSAIGSCISKEENGRANIVVDGSKCIACGSCIDVCEHNAREFNDDTARFFKDLESGREISILLAPAFKANYPERYESILGGLKKMGVKRIISVSFGADITTWGYLNYIKKHNFLGGISQPCPALVAYIERYIPELIPKLFPVQSPLMCAAIYAREELGIRDSFAFISPCIAKKMEIEDPHNAGLVQYNVTFDHLIKYVDEHGLSGDPAHSEIEYGLGSFYPTPGGLAENVKWFLGDEVFIRQVEGEKHLYEWLHQNTDRIKNNETPFLFIDALNCEKGCICGTAVDPSRSKTDDSLYELLKIREASKKESGGSAWSRHESPEERLENYNRQFENLDLDHYIRGYTDRSDSCEYSVPDEETLDRIFLSMNKLTEESRRIDCTCCGYASCLQMAHAIYNGFNHRENCIYYEKTMVRELETEKTIAEASTRAKSAFLANMSHEIRTPINAILGMDELILRESTEDSVKQYALNIQKSGNTLLSLVNNILDFSKIESGKIEIIPNDYELSGFIRIIENMVSQRIEEKGIRFYIKADEDIPRYLYGDHLRIGQCVIHILNNALKYTEKGEIRLFIEYAGKDDNEVSIRFRISDTGIGIKEEDLARLFTAFERIDLKKNRTIEGTGLGMNIVQSLLALMDSHLDVSSKYGEGSVFSFLINQKITKDVPLGDYKIPDEEEINSALYGDGKFTAPSARVLIVDDTAVNLIVAKGFLKGTEINVDTAEDAIKALELLQANVYDLLFFDHMMPDTDGIELLHILKKRTDNPNSRIPCIVLTANAIQGAREEYLKEGFDDYMSKPLDGTQFELLLKHYLPEEKIIPVEGSLIAEAVDPEDENIPESFKNIPGIDVKAGIKNCGSFNDYLPILKIFYDSLEMVLKELASLYSAKDLVNYTIKVHAFKSSSRLIGASELGEDAQALESAGKAGDLDYIRANHAPLLSKAGKYRELLEPLFEEDEEDESGKPAADEAMIKENFEKILEGARDLDMNPIEEAIDELNCYSLPEEAKKIFRDICALYDSFDYDGIAELLS